MATQLLTKLLERLRKWQGYIFAVLAVFVVWIFSTMSEVKSYTEVYPYQVEGIDTARYAVSRADTTLTLELQSNGFNALRRSLEPRRTLHIDIAKLVPYPISQPTDLNIHLHEALPTLTPQLRMSGVRDVKPGANSLHLTISPRESRKFVADLSQVQFVFDGSHGLDGNIRLVPDSVVLYGSRESLDQVVSLRAQPTTFYNIRRTTTFRVALEGDWKRHSDLRCSTDSISIYLPVQPFVEKRFTLPVEVITPVEGLRVQLHPSTVTLRCMVAEKNYSHIDASQFRATATYRSDADDYLEVIVSQFPSNVRIMDITPSHLQYTVIQ